MFNSQHQIAESLFLIDPPENEEPLRANINKLINGALLAYLLSIWDAYMPNESEEWFDDESMEKLDAFKHVRDSAAHKYKGWRANFQRRRNAFEAQMPFSNIYWNNGTDLVDISESNVARDCYAFMLELLDTLRSPKTSDY